MSELIDNNRQRRETLKQIIRDIHNNKNVEELKMRFKDLLTDVGASEIGHMEQELIQEGLPEAEVKSLCDVHVSVFKESLAKQAQPVEEGGHPIQTLKKENTALEAVIRNLRDLYARLKSDGRPENSLEAWRRLHQQLLEVEKHYSRKENILFAYLEKHGVSGPAKVMWAIHDDIRAELKEMSQDLKKDLSREELVRLAEEKGEPILKAIEDMIYKETNILFPMSLETLTEGEWAAITEQSAEIGYTLITPDHGWVPKAPPEPLVPAQTKPLEGETGAQTLLPFETGVLTLEQISLIFNHLPVDITFVDKDDVVRYFSLGKERIFQRSKAIIGRKVQNCHPPDSVHIVNRIVSDFKSGKRDSADFRIHMEGKYVYIRYFALRDQAGEYAGTIEVTQDIQEIQSLEGERRLDTEG